MKTIGIVGSRRRDAIEDYQKCFKVFMSYYEDGDKIVSGGCPKGGDKFAELIAKEFDIPIVIHSAQWKVFGRRAGFIRNTKIAEDSDILIAVVAPDRKGGTEDTVKKVQMRGKKVVLVM